MVASSSTAVAAAANTATTTTTASRGNNDTVNQQQPQAQQSEEEEEEDDEASLSQLLAALAVGARAVQGLPLDDEFDYQASFPEFASQLNSTKAALLDVLAMALASSSDANNSGGSMDATTISEDLLEDNPYIWEKCAEACDVLLEDVELYLEQIQQQHRNLSTTNNLRSTANQWEHWSARAKKRAQGTFQKLVQGLVEMVKPQITYHNNMTVQNDRHVPFLPKVHPDKPFGITPLDLSLQPGHGLDTRLASIKSIHKTTTTTSSTTNNNSIVATRYPDNMIAPSHHVPHVYQTEIESFTYRPWQLQAHPPTFKMIPVVDPLEATWIDTEPALEQLAAKLANVSHVAMDLEAHSHRSFSGMTCLIQLSIRRSSNETAAATTWTTPTKGGAGGGSGDGPLKEGTSVMENYLLDPFALGATVVNKHLAATLANPDIVKVMHGADWDIAWLQRDFGLYVVNLFDTGRAARALKFPSAGYAYLLHSYVGITAEKHYQLSDWRQRAIPLDMQQYAIRDTHYLLDIYERLKWDLEQQDKKNTSSEATTSSIIQVLDVSRKVCLIRYDKEPFQPDGYKWLLGGQRAARRAQHNSLTAAQERVLATLWDWRDETARACDESLLYVCPNPALVRLSLASPTTVAALQSVLHPIPPLLLRFAPNVVDRIKRALMMINDDTATNNNNNNIVNVKAEDATAEAAAVTTTTTRIRPPQTPVVEEADDDEVANTSSRSRSRQTPAPSSPYFKPAELLPDRSDHQARHLLSPVLGTEALYQQAGWMTPQNHPDMGTNNLSGRRTSSSGDQDDDNDERDMELATTNTTTSDDEDCDPCSSKPKHLLVVDKANQHYKAADYMSHSLEMKVGKSEHGSAGGTTTSIAAMTTRRGRSVDGLGPTRVLRERSKSPTPSSLTAEEQAQQAHHAAARVRISLSRKEEDLTMISPSTELNEDDDDDDDDDDDGEEHHHGAREQEGGDKDNAAAEHEGEEEFVIPRSLKEIYKISNQNRRNKKSSPTPERSGGGPSGNETELNALARAEALLKARGLNGRGYFDSGDAGNKRQRTKSTESESEEFPNASDGANVNNSANVSRDDDMAFMQEMGWIQNKEEAEKLLAQRQGERAESGAPESAAGGQADDDNVDDDDTKRAPSTTNTSSSRPRDGSSSRQSHHQQPSPAFDYSTVGAIGAFQSQAPSNPFFAGAALTGGALAQGFARGGPERKRSGGRGGGGNKQQQQGRARERPEKKDARTYVYKKK